MEFDIHIWVDAAAYIGAGIAIGFGAIGAAIGEGYTAAQANQAISKNPDISGDIIKTMLVGQAIAESAGIFALIIAIILVYMILVALYDSYVYPFVVLFSIPLAVIGALLALALTMESISIFSILGMVMLVGLVGKNAILVVDFTNRLKENGMKWKEALITATKLRFRPILMTNITMIIGLLPLALASGAGSEWKNGLAWALIGGLTSSMFLTLIIVPVIYFMVERWLERTGLSNSKKVKIPEDLLHG